MKFFAALALAALAAASPHPATKCTSGTYRCIPAGNSVVPGWEVCGRGNWVFAGDCPPSTVCKFLQSNGSPYCVHPDFHFTV